MNRKRATLVGALLGALVLVGAWAAPSIWRWTGHVPVVGRKSTPEEVRAAREAQSKCRPTTCAALGCLDYAEGYTSTKHDDDGCGSPLVCGGCSKIPAKPQAADQPAPTRPYNAVAEYLDVGAVGVLRSSDGQTSVPLFGDKTAFDDFYKAVVAKDQVGFDEALLSSTPVASGTRARKIDVEGYGHLFGGNSDKVRVRVEGGPNAGFAGWVLATALRKE
jgi:hypothetical protein